MAINKILFLTLSTYDYVGGIQTFNKYFVKSLNDNSYDWSLVSLHDDSKSNKKNIFCCNHSLLRFIFYILKLTDSKTIIIWNHISLASIYKYLKFVINSNKNILVVYGTEVWKPTLASRKKKALFYFDEIWTISSYTKNALITTHGVPGTKFRYFPCCISIKEEKQTSNPFKSQQVNVVTILRLDESKKLTAIYNIVESIPFLIDQGVAIHFTVIGTGNAADKVSQFVKDREMEKHVTFTGYVDDTQPYLQHCDIFTLISDGEGFGIVYLEAMQFEKCCLSAKNCGSQDVVLNEETGLSVSVDNISEIEAALLKLSNNKKLREEYGINGRKHLLNNFTFEVFKETQKRILDSL